MERSAEWTVTTLWRDEAICPFDIVATRDRYVVAAPGLLLLLDRSGRELRRRELDSEPLSLAVWGEVVALLTWRGVLLVDAETLEPTLHTPADLLDAATILQVTAATLGYFIGNLPVLVSTSGRPVILDREHKVLCDLSRAPAPVLDFGARLHPKEIVYDVVLENEDVIVSLGRRPDVVGLAGKRTGSLIHGGLPDSVSRLVPFGEALVGIALVSQIVLIRDGVVTVIAGKEPDSLVDGAGERARFYLPGSRGLLVDGETILVVDTMNGALRQMRQA